MRRADTRGRNNGSPEDVADRLKVTLNSVEPRSRSFVSRISANLVESAWLADDRRAGDLLAEDDGGSPSTDEVEVGGPEVALVGGAFSASGRGERLARARDREDFTVVGPACST